MSPCCPASKKSGPQFGPLPHLLWPLTMHDITLTRVERMDRTINAYVRKWLGVPQSLSRTALYGQGLFQLPLSSLQEFKCTKVRLEMTLTELKDSVIRATAPTLATGWKWTPKTSVQQVKFALQHNYIVGQVQHGLCWPGVRKTLLE